MEKNSFFWGVVASFLISCVYIFVGLLGSSGLNQSALVFFLLLFVGLVFVTILKAKFLTKVKDFLFGGRQELAGIIGKTLMLEMVLVFFSMFFIAAFGFVYKNDYTVSESLWFFPAAYFVYASWTKFVSKINYDKLLLMAAAGFILPGVFVILLNVLLSQLIGSTIGPSLQTPIVFVLFALLSSPLFYRLVQRISAGDFEFTAQKRKN